MTQVPQTGSPQTRGEDLGPLELEMLVRKLIESAPGQRADTAYITKYCLREEVRVLPVMNTIAWFESIGLVVRGFQAADGTMLTPGEALAACRNHEKREGLQQGQATYGDAGIVFYWELPSFRPSKGK